MIPRNIVSFNQINTLSQRDVTLLLQAWSEGDKTALEKLAPVVYAELRRLARQQMARDRSNRTLETGALLNEAYLRLAHWKNAKWDNRGHFFGVTAQIMRRVLVDRARLRNYQKRGDGVRAIPLEEAIVASPEQSPDIIQLHEALERLEIMDPRKGKVVELRFFGGLSVQETADVLKVSPFTVIRDWNLAKAWLHREISGTLQ